MYDFRSLLPADFEDLILDLIGAALGVSFEAFAPGPDCGIDGRHSSSNKTTILQAKHLVGSGTSKLKTTMRKERAAIDKLDPSRYVLGTSCSLSPPNKSELAKIIGPALVNQSDLMGKEQLNKLLRDNPEIERAHLKLWLSRTAVLDAVLNAGSYAFTATTKQEIAEKVRVYAQNPSLAEAQKILDKHHVLIVSGPPGVGKTTLAEILSFGLIGDKHELVAIRSLDDGFDRINDEKKQIFFFDDFLGTIALDKRSLASTDSALAKFMNRIRRSPNARFIMTTRAYILKEAQSTSERLADDRVDLSTFVLDMDAYSRAIRARILYNHLIVGNTPSTHIDALIESGRVSEIVDHKNYNPRIIEWMTDAMRLGEVSAENYVAHFLSVLRNPTRLWETAFNEHISSASRHLLMLLFFSGDGGEVISRLRTGYEAYHSKMCAKYGIEQGPRDFEASLKHLEGGFLEITNDSVDFINPSLRDFMSSVLSNGMLLPDIAGCLSSGKAVRTMWSFVQQKPLPRDLSHSIVEEFLSIIPLLKTAPHWKSGPERTWISTDIDNSRRVELLVQWWGAIEEEKFLLGAIEILKDPPQGFSSWRDGQDLLELLHNLDQYDTFDGNAVLAELKVQLELSVVSLIKRPMASEDLERISDFVFENEGIPEAIGEAISDAIRSEIENVDDVVGQMESESDIEDHGAALKRLAPRATVSAANLARAMDRVEERAFQVQDRSNRSSSSSPTDYSKLNVNEDFDDQALVALFAGLREHVDNESGD